MSREARLRYALVMGPKEDHFVRYFVLMIVFLGFLLGPQLYKQYQANPKLQKTVVGAFKNLTFRTVVSQ